MYRIRLSICASTVLVGTTLCGFSVSAAKITSTASLNTQYTDNAALVSTNEDSDLLLIAGVGATIDAGSGPFQFKAETELSNTTYTQNTFSDQQYVSLGATAGWEMVRDRFDWQLQDYFSQQAINSLDANTPDNIQDTNIFTFGANISLPLSVRQSLNFMPEYRKFTFDGQNVDNQQNSLNTSWIYQMFRTVSFGLSGNYNKVDYDNSSVGSNTFRTISFTAVGQRARSSFNLALGNTHVERENGTSERGFSGSVTWLRNISTGSTLRAYFTSELTDCNNGLLSSSVDPENGEFSNQQISAEVVRNRAIRLTYSTQKGTLNSTVWADLSEQDYETVLIDRDVTEFGMSLNYPVTAMLSTGINTRYTHTELTDVNRKDDQYSVGGSLTYRLSRRLSSSLRVNYQDKDSTLDIEDFTELSVFAGLSYDTR